MQGFLKYDDDVFETITESSIDGLNSWSPKYDESTGKITLTKSSFVKSSQEVFQITFKSKSGVSGQSGAISYNNISASNSEENISATDISTKITVGTSSEDEEETSNSTSNVTVISPTTTSSNRVSNINTNSNTSKNITTNTNKNTIAINSVVATTPSNNEISNYVNINNTSEEENMPYTGVSDNILGVIFAVIAIAFIFYIKIEKINNDMR